MALELRTLGREVRAEVRATALLACERALGNEPREEVRRVEEMPEPFGVADETAVVPERRAELGCHVLGSRSGGDVGEPRREARLAERRERRTTPEDEAFEKRVRCEAVRAVHARRCALACGVQTGELAAPVEVGENTADGVVRSRCNRKRP